MFVRPRARLARCKGCNEFVFRDAARTIGTRKSFFEARDFVITPQPRPQRLRQFRFSSSSLLFAIPFFPLSCRSLSFHYSVSCYLLRAATRLPSTRFLRSARGTQVERIFRDFFPLVRNENCLFRFQRTENHCNHRSELN